MANLTKAQKAKKIEANVIPLFEKHGTDVNAVCTDYIKENMEALMSGNPIQFTELEGIVRQIGLDNEFLKKVVERKQDASAQIERETGRGFKDRADFEGYVADIAQFHAVSETWVNNEIHKIYKEVGRAGLIPPKDHLKEWQRAFYNAYIENPNISQDDMKEILVATGNLTESSCNQYVSAFMPILQEIRENN